MGKKLTEIEGIGETYADKLKNMGISTQDCLLEKGCSKSGRQTIAGESGLSEKKILNWVNRADLSRVKGVGEEYADLLEHSGVDTIPDLATRNAKNLFEKMTSVNSEKNLVRAMPSESTVEDWVAQAKKLPRVVNY